MWVYQNVVFAHRGKSRAYSCWEYIVMVSVGWGWSPGGLRKGGGVPVDGRWKGASPAMVWFGTRRPCLTQCNFALISHIWNVRGTSVPWGARGACESSIHSSLSSLLLRHSLQSSSSSCEERERRPANGHCNLVQLFPMKFAMILEYAQKSDSFSIVKKSLLASSKT